MMRTVRTQRTQRRPGVLALAGLLTLGAVVAGGLGVESAVGGERLVVGVSAVGAGQGGFLLARDGGFFAELGLDVDPVFFGAGTEAIQAIASGQLSVALVAGPSVINANLAGLELVWIAALVDTVPYVLVTSPDIAKPADLRGKRIGVNRFGSSAEFAARFALTRLGLDPRTDVTLLQMGQQAARLAALKAGTIEATLIEPPSTVMARKLGLRTLVDLSTMGLRTPHEAVTVSKQALRDRPETFRRLVRGLIKGIHAFKTRPDDGMAVLRKYLKVDDVEALAEAYAVFSRLSQRKPYVALEGVQLMLDELAATDPRARALRPEALVDLRFVRELDQEGFIDALYR